MRKPEFITFTGADDRTDVRALTVLSLRYPIEWGILFSKSRQGKEQRYPGGSLLTRIAYSSHLRLAAHICGGWGRAIVAGEDPSGEMPIDLAVFKRAQINHTAPEPKSIAKFGRSRGLHCIAQTRGPDAEFPKDIRISWLFDASGGTGRRPEPKEWPPHPGRDRVVGYAGGITPDNVLQIMSEIDPAGPYWLDMESGVRDASDRFDVEACRRVCEAVFA